MEYEKTPIKPSKAKAVKQTAKKQSVKATDNIHGAILAWIVFKRLVRFMWVNKVAITVNAFLLENGYLFVHYTHFFK